MAIDRVACETVRIVWLLAWISKTLNKWIVKCGSVCAAAALYKVERAVKVTRDWWVCRAAGETRRAAWSAAGGNLLLRCYPPLRSQLCLEMCSRDSLHQSPKSEPGELPCSIVSILSYYNSRHRNLRVETKCFLGIPILLKYFPMNTNLLCLDHWENIPCVTEEWN